LAQAHGLQKILFQNLARRDVFQQFAFHLVLMVIHNFHFVSPRFPAKADPTLTITRRVINASVSMVIAAVHPAEKGSSGASLTIETRKNGGPPVGREWGEKCHSNA
jgi:hypothetical protein